MLPVPPTDTEKYSYVRRHVWMLSVFAALSVPPLVYGQVRMVLNSTWFYVYVPFALFGVLCFLLSVTADGMSRGFDLAEHKRIVAGWRPLWYPSVDVFLPVCGEPLEVLRNAWTHVAQLRRQYRGMVTPYVLDDSASPQIKAMARRFGFAYATRPNRGWFKKSGNLLYGFGISDSEYILLLDADFAPRPDLLDETLPYMDMHPDVGIVQTPQFFHVLDEQTWVERGAGRGPGAVLPVDPDRQVQPGRRGVRGQLRRLPEEGARGEPGHVARGALGGPAHRLRPAPDGLDDAVHPDRALHRKLPGQHPGVPQPAVPLVLRHHEPAGQQEVLDRPSCRCAPGCATCPGSSTTSTPRCSRS